MSDASEAGRLLRAIKTEKRTQSDAQNAAKAREALKDPAVQAEANRKRSEAQKARWDLYRQQKAAEQKGQAAE